MTRLVLFLTPPLSLGAVYGACCSGEDGETYALVGCVVVAVAAALIWIAVLDGLTRGAWHSGREGRPIP